jgi:DNA-binding XRE family transcriptional regulator
MFYYDVKESGKRLKALRRSCGHIQETMAEAIGISIDTLYKIATSLGTDANTIIGLNPEAAPIDAKLSQLEPEMKQKFEALFSAMLDQAESGLYNLK